MKTEQQNKAWACLPKATRDYAKRIYQYECSVIDYNEGANETLESLFGSHNLTSDTEPDEAFIVWRKDAQATYAYNEQILKFDPTHQGARLLKSYLEETFGSKCLPDKSPEEKNDMEIKFNLGDKVEVDDEDDERIYTVIDILENDGYVWYKLRHGESKERTEMNHDLKLYNKSNELMEEKELNLCGLLKGHEEEEFYCHYLRRDVKFIGFDECDGMTFKLRTCKDGVGYENLMYIEKNEKIGKSVILYPSRALYEKYPLDAKKAWAEWAESRKPKRWRAKKEEENDGIREEYYFLDGMLTINCQYDVYDYFCNNHYHVGNYFRTESDAKQAAEEVKQCLEAFHTRNGNI